MSNDNAILVYAHWAGMTDPVSLGTLRGLSAGSKQLFEFTYDKDWLKHHSRIVLDPQLRFSSGKFYTSEGSANFGMFADASPGSWGRALLRRYESSGSRSHSRATKVPDEADYLLRVFDFYRSGALRFKTEADGDFLTSDEQFILPSTSNLRDLELASVMLAEDHSLKEFDSAMTMLVASGAVLGGKRAKATVIDNDWQMWIAKFPTPKDIVDVGGWEFVAHTMAGLSGINTVPAMLKKLNYSHHAFMVQRFDRTKRGERLHFASATTMLGYSGSSGVSPSYLDIAAFLMQNGADVNADLEELWRRIVFNISIRNTDDHLNNHGFLLTDAGWKLSPVFDLNPDPMGQSLSLNISESDNSLSLDLAMSVAPYFRVTQARAKKIAHEIQLVKTQWNKFAVDAGLSKTEQEKMSEAFR